ncbi:MAG: RagB/SusD family nutrient uptake outer membrane protein [Bacteroidota bacterium]
MMKKTAIIYSLIALLAILSSCDDDYLERYPLDRVSEGAFFTSSKDLEIYVNRFYSTGVFIAENLSWYAFSRGRYSSETHSDNMLFENEISERLHGTRVVPAAGGGWSYGGIRSVNYFFEHYQKCEAPLEEYQQYLGEAYFFRALIYFNLLQDFGDVVWITTVPGMDSEELYTARTPRNEVVDHIITDLDSAIHYLTEERIEKGTRINRWYALGFQSRVALYEGSWERYHAGSAFGVDNPDPDKYFTRAVAAAEEVMNSGRFEIYSTGNPEKDYYDFFVLPDYSGSKSVMFWEKFSIALDKTNKINVLGIYPKGEGLTKDLIDSYLCTDGDPITVSPLFGGYDTLMNEVKERDPRLKQSVWTPDAPWKITDGDTAYWETIWLNLNSKSNHYCPTAYGNRKGYNADTRSHNQSGEETPMIHFRYAEVLLNYIEAKAELGMVSQADIDISLKLLRDRVGMPNLDMANISVDPDWDFPTLPPLINEIRRERRVELVSEGNRWHDIARWAAADELIEGKRPKGIKTGPDGNFLEHTTYPVDDEGFLDPWFDALGAGGYGFDVERDYLFPIPSNELTLNPKLGQNPGW